MYFEELFSRKWKSAFVFTGLIRIKYDRKYILPRLEKILQQQIYSLKLQFFMAIFYYICTSHIETYEIQKNSIKVKW